MKQIIYFNRVTGQREVEKVYGQKGLDFLYGQGCLSRWIGRFFLSFIARYKWPSRLYGFWQKTRWSRRKIAPFIKNFQIDPKEFLEPIEHFRSFNDFFIRKLKKESRPFESGADRLTMPADARYLVFPNIAAADGFFVKGKKFTLESLLQDSSLSASFQEGSMVMARLCPTDYHRFHFPCDGVPGEPRLINGYLFSVNPQAICQNIQIFGENKRVITRVQTASFGEMLYIEVGATSVGSIQQTFIPHRLHAKGDEKGYFSFGGSSLLLLFPPNRVVFDSDLVEYSARKIEVRGLLGQGLGRAQC